MNKYSGTVNLEVMSHAENYNRFLTKLVLSQAKAGDLILDLGAGIGTFAKRIAELGYPVCCIEPDPNQASVITNLGLTVLSDLTQIENDSLDYVYTLNVLEHIEDDHALLRELYYKIKPGGRLLIYVPAFQLLYSSMDQKVGHYRRYTRKSLDNLVSHAGFNVVTTRYADSLGFLASILYKLLGNNSGVVSVRSLVAYDRMVFPVSRIMDKLLGLLIGKNVLLVGTK